MRPMICSIFNSFLLHFELTFLRFLSQTLLWWLIFFIYFLSSLHTLSLSQAAFTGLKTESHFSYRFIFGRYRFFLCCYWMPPGLCDIVECFRSHSQFKNEHETEWQSGRIYLEFFITSWNLRARCSFLAVFFSCILAMGERKLGKSLIQE